MDYTGKQIGNILILKRADGDIETAKTLREINNKIGYDPKYECQCLLCNKVFISSIGSIKRRVNKNCGCNKLQYDLINKKFGKLTVIKKVGLSSHNEMLWECICECGEKTTKTSYSLRNDKNPKCKTCSNKEIGDKNRKYIIFSKRLHEMFVNMKTRCYNEKSKSYYLYGGRGIKVCKEWINNYSAFQDWALNNGYKDNLTLDRMDNNGDYEPDNCRFVDRRVQANNRKSNLNLIYQNREDTLANWCRKLKLCYSKVQYRLYNGMTLTEIVEEGKCCVDNKNGHKGEVAQKETTA